VEEKLRSVIIDFVLMQSNSITLLKHSFSLAIVALEETKHKHMSKVGKMNSKCKDYALGQSETLSELFQKRYYYMLNYSRILIGSYLFGAPHG